jgi:hypothetical protein
MIGATSALFLLEARSQKQEARTSESVAEFSGENFGPTFRPSVV